MLMKSSKMFRMGLRFVFFLFRSTTRKGLWLSSSSEACNIVWCYCYNHHHTHLSNGSEFFLSFFVVPLKNLWLSWSSEACNIVGCYCYHHHHYHHHLKKKGNRKRGGGRLQCSPPLEVARDLPRSDLVRRFTSEFPKVVLSRETSSKISRVPWPLEEAFSSFIKPSRLCPPKSDFDHQDGFKKAFLVLLRAFFGPLEGMFGPSCAILEP